MVDGDDRFMERWWCSVDGLNLFARDYYAPSGPARLPVICLHGLTRNSRDFEEVAPEIAALGRRVLVPDIRGRGRSDPDPDAAKYVVTTYARDVLAMMDSLGIAKAIFVGTSMGGLITLAVAGWRRSAIAGAVLNDVGPEIAPEGIARIAGYVGKSAVIEDWNGASDYLKRIMGDSFPEFGASDWKAMARRSFRADEFGTPRPDYDPAINTPIAGKRIKSSSWIAWHLFRRLVARCPILLIRGEISDLLTAGIANKMRRVARTMQIVEVPRVGHAPLLSEPEAADAIAAFLARLP